MGPVVTSKGLELLVIEMFLANSRPFNAIADYNEAATNAMLNHAFSANIVDSASSP